MKKTIMIMLAFVLATGAFAQTEKTKFRAAAGISQEQYFHQDVELGFQSGNEVVTTLVDVYNYYPNVRVWDNLRFIVGIKYLHLFPVNKWANITLGGAGKMRTNNVRHLTLEPQAGVYVTGKHLGLNLYFSTPFNNQGKKPFERVATGAQIVARF